MIHLYSVIVLLTMMFSGNLFGQLTPYITTGRPSNTAGPYTVDPGMWHLEAGFSVESAQRFGQPLRFYNLSVPGLDIRTGISEDVEFNIGVVEKIDFLGGSSKGGFGPVNLGLKFNVYKSKNWLPNISFVSKVALPVGSEVARPEYLSPSMKLLFAHFFAKKMVVMYNLGAFWQGDNAVRGNYTLMYGYSFMENLTGYAELYGGFTKRTDFVSNLAGGLMYAPKPNWQVDISGGLDLQKDYEAYYVAFGYSLRFFTSKKE